MAQMIFAQGTEIGELAQKKYPGGVLIAEDHEHLDAAVVATEKAVAAGATILYEAAAVQDGTVVRADIMTKNDDGSWDLIEVKSSTYVKEVHMEDLGVQKYVLEKAGYKINLTAILHINNAYERDGEIDLKALFILSELQVDPAALGVSERIATFRAIVEQQEAPEIGIGERCTKPYPCDFKEHCWASVPKDSVWKIGGIKKKLAADLWRRGIKRITEVPPATKLSAKQGRQVDVTKSGHTFIDKRAIRNHLDGLKFPLHFLDFEAVAPGLPPYDGLKPFETLPVQASIHTLASRDARVEHFEFLADPERDPRKPMAEFLASKIAPSGSVIAYNASYEGKCLKTLYNETTDLGGIMVGLKERLWDIAAPFRAGHYMTQEFNGSWSLKKVLPVLVPTMTYTDLTIGEGGSASALYWEAMCGRLTGPEREKVFAALIKYCAYDTLAMVEILRVLWAVTEKATA